MKNKIDRNINLALRWLIKSGIQNQNIKNLTKYGGFNAWYDITSKKYSYLYSEITGYLITSMLFHYEVTKKKFFLKSAELSANWLINNAQDKYGGFKCLYLIDKNLSYKKKENYIYSFDNGVIINGLVNLYKITKKKKYLNSANKSGSFLISNFFKRNFELKPIFDIKKKKYIHSKHEWSMISGSYHTKACMGLINLYSVNKQKHLLTFAKKLLNFYTKKQKKSKLLKSTNNSTNFHPYCYSLEGYWSCGKFLRSKRYLETSNFGTRELLKKINSDGLPPRILYKNKLNYNERIDILCQTLRLIILNLSQKKLTNIEKEKINKLIKNILMYQKLKNKNLKINGGFLWGKKSDGNNTNNVNSWVTSFAAQSLSIFNNKKAVKILNSKPFYLV